jgi:hypothetical protein
MTSPQRVAQQDWIMNGDGGGSGQNDAVDNGMRYNVETTMSDTQGDNHSDNNGVGLKGKGRHISGSHIVDDSDDETPDEELSRQEVTALLRDLKLILTIYAGR